jgi:hypothetical protein
MTSRSTFGSPATIVRCSRNVIRSVVCALALGALEDGCGTFSAHAGQEIRSLTLANPTGSPC